jgi:hypothetical protein
MLKLFFLLFPLFLLAQPNTDVFLIDINFNSIGIEVSNFTNISNQEGYDNQPSFDFDDFVLYARNNKGQTDIYQYHITNKTNTLLNKTTSGGEFSPQRIPNNFDVAAVRLDITGLQRLYNYNEKTGESEILIEDLQVAYFAFYDSNTIVSSVIDGDGGLNLVVSNLSTKTNNTIVQKVGRSIHKVPHSKHMSYTSINEENNNDVYMLDMKTLESFFVCQLPIDINDFAWLDGDRMIIGSGSKIFVYEMFGSQEWEELIDLTKYNVKNITRLTVHPSGKKIAFVAELSMD